MTTTAASILLQGNSLAWVQTDGRGAVTSLTPIPWVWTSANIVGGPGRARLVYDLSLSTPESTLLGLPRRLLDSDVLHIRGRSETGILGRSVLSRGGGPIREAIEVNTVAEATWKNGMRPSGSLTTDQSLDKAGRDRLRENMQSFLGSANTGKVLVLEQNLKFIPITLNPADAQLLESRRFSVSEICRLFGVPEPLIQIGGRPPSDYASVIAAFAQVSVSPLVNAIEDEITATVLPPGYRLNLDMAGLLRGSYAALVGAQSVALQAGALTPNDVRRSLGLPALPGGDDLRPAGAAPSYPADAKGVPSLGPKPGPGGALPNVGTHENDGNG